MSDEVDIRPLDEIIREAEKQSAKVTHVKLASGLSHEEELFCQAMAKHGDQWRAVQEAGYHIKDKKNANTKAWKLLQRDRVVKRIDSLKNATALRNNVTADHVIEMLMAVYKEAMAASKFDAANRACEMLGNYLDIFKNAGRPASVTNVLNISDKALMDREIKRLASAAGVKLLEDKEVI
jgi:hypothetical protein